MVRRSNQKSSTKPARIHTKVSINTPQHFYADLEKAVDKVLPTKAQKYTRVSVMGLTWSNDDTGRAKSSQDSLLSILQKTYNFKTQSYVIPHGHSRPTSATKKALQKWLPTEPDDACLYILIYSGHGATNPTNDKLSLAGAVDRAQALGLASPTIRLADLLSYVYESASGHFLHVFDTCERLCASAFSGAETLSAAGFGDSVERFFVRLLAERLEALDGAPRSVGQIYADIVRRHREGRKGGDEAMPIHFLGEDDGRASVVLQRRRVDAPRQMGNLEEEERQRGIDAMAGSILRVLVSVNVAAAAAAGDEEEEKRGTGVGDWGRLVTSNMGPLLHAVAVRVESVVRTDEASLLLFVSMPVEVWDALPEGQEAYGFVSFVK